MDIPLVGGLVATTLFGLAYLCSVRLLLVLPAVAIGRKESLVESFRLTRGNGWRLSLLVLLALWPTYICYEIIEYFFFVDNDVFERVEPIEYLILEAMISWFFFTIDISVMALAYKMLVSEASLGQPMSSL
jgi:hypothetical protein